jgi:hypothetical protein
MRRTPSFLAAVLALWVGPAVAQAPAAPAAAAPYPVAVRLVMAPDALGQTYMNRSSDVLRARYDVTPIPVGQQTRAAYEAGLARMFLASAEGTSQLGVTMDHFGVGGRTSGWFAFVEHSIALRDESGREIARWRVRGEAATPSLGDEAVEQAFAQAARVAAMELEVEFEERSAVVEWLRAHGAAPGSRLAWLPQMPKRLVPRAVLDPSPRSDRLLYLDAGGGAVAVHGSMGSAFELRGGWSTQRLLLQAAVEATPATFTAHPSYAWGTASGRAWVFGLGGDAGVVQRLGSRVDLCAGAGLRLLLGPASARYAPMTAPLTTARKSDLGTGADPQLFLASRIGGVVPATDVRYRVGLEVRKHFGAGLRMSALERTVRVSDVSGAVTLGVEWPGP